MAATRPIDERWAPTYINLCFIKIRDSDGRKEWYQLLVPTLPVSTSPVSQAVSTVLSQWSDGSEQTDSVVNVTVNDGQQDHEYSVSLNVHGSRRLQETGAYVIDWTSLHQSTVGVRYGHLEYKLDEDDEDNIDVTVNVQPPHIIPIDDETCENGENRSNCSVSYLNARLDYIESKLEKMSSLGRF